MNTKSTYALLWSYCANKLFIKRSKCEFGVNALKFLGHVIPDKDITMDPDKLKAILEWPEPAGTPAQCKTQLKGFLGLAFQPLHGGSLC